MNSIPAAKPTPSISECPDENLFVSILQGDSGSEARQSLDDHIDQCTSCAELFAELAFLVSSNSLPATVPAEVQDRGSLRDFEEPTLHTPSLSLTQRIAGRYEILRQVGAGGMGTVYEAYDDALKRKVAIKLLRPDLLDPAIREACSARLLREARLLAAIYHPHVLNVYDVGVWKEAIFIAIQFIEGETLKDWLKTHNAPWRDVLQIFLDVGDGLVEAHKQGLIHRDIKPENILIDPQGCAWLADFGLARAIGSDVLFTASEDDDEDPSKPAKVPVTPLDLSTVTRTGAVMGTPAYMAPEQHLGQPTDERTDQFSLAVSIYEALYGERPFKGKTRKDLQEAVCSHTVAPPPKTPHPPALYRVLKKAMSAKPADRYPTLVHFLEDVRHAASSVPIWRRGAVFWLSLALVSMSGVAVAGWYSASNSTETAQTQTTPSTTPSEPPKKEEDPLADLDLDLDLPDIPAPLTKKQKEQLQTDSMIALRDECLGQDDPNAFACRVLHIWVSNVFVDLEYEGFTGGEDERFKTIMKGMQDRSEALCKEPHNVATACTLAAFNFSFSRHDYETPEGSMIPHYNALMRRACELGEPMGCMSMRNVYAQGSLDSESSNGTFAIPVSEKVFLETVGERCEAGDGMLCWWMAEVYWSSNRKDFKKNHVKALEYFEKACMADFAQGCVFAGLIHTNLPPKECNAAVNVVSKHIATNNVIDDVASWGDVEAFCRDTAKLRKKLRLRPRSSLDSYWTHGCLTPSVEVDAFFNTMQTKARVLSCGLSNTIPDGMKGMAELF